MLIITELGMVFAQDHASTHTAFQVQDWLLDWAESNGVTLVDWPDQYPISARLETAAALG